jgi:signal recognition particle receptor subunit beta
MVVSEDKRRGITCKVVFWGPEQGGKTTNLRVIHRRTPAAKRGELTTISVSGGGEFELVTLDLGRVGSGSASEGSVGDRAKPSIPASIPARFELYTVPGRPDAASMRRLIIEKVDGIVFVADSAPERMQQNRESLAQLHDALRAQGRDPATVPTVFQWNKRERSRALPVQDLERELNPGRAPSRLACASLGEGVVETLRLLSRAVLRGLRDETLPLPLAPIAPAVTEPVPAAPPHPRTAKTIRVERRRDDSRRLLASSSSG